jgi:hypothetical protein
MWWQCWDRQWQHAWAPICKAPWKKANKQKEDQMPNDMLLMGMLETCATEGKRITGAHGK